MLAAGLGGNLGRRPRTIRIKPDHQFTKCLFGEVSDYLDQELEVISTNDQGDCMCIIETNAEGNKNGKALIDVDHRDIVK